MSESRRRIRELVRQRRVEWEEFRFAEGGQLPEPQAERPRLRRRSRRSE